VGGAEQRADIMLKWKVDEDTLRPLVLDTLQPRELSYWIASIFAENPLHQQSLLQVGIRWPCEALSLLPESALFTFLLPL
jgi:hypothetical protein